METTNKYASMGKEELRQACREAGISYGKLNNDGMRAALTANDEAKQETKPANKANGLSLSLGQLMGVPPATVPVRSENVTRVVEGKKVEGKNKGDKGTRERAEKAPAPSVPRVSRKGYTIQKNREERNGVKRPSEGTVCGAVWSVFDAMHNSEAGLKAADLPALADEHGWNRTNVSCEYYAWRKFNGIKGRSAK